MSKAQLGGPPMPPTGSASHNANDQTPTIQPETWKTAIELIRRAAHVLLICHVSPDGDAIGSLLGLGLGLRTLGKTPTLACESPLPPNFSFLPGYDSVIKSANPAAFDLIISLDCSDPARMGNVYKADLLQKSGDFTENGLEELPLINIDHHVTNLFFGDVNLVDAKTASTAEIVLTLLDRLGVSVDGDGGNIATCLLTGIVTDTVGFRTSSVTTQVMAATLRLVEAGASLSEVTNYAFNQRPLVELNLLARGLNRMQTEGTLAWSEISLADRRACGHEGNSDAGLVGTLVRTREIHIAAVFSEKESDQVEISFRADPGFDVAQLALDLGGGGHPAAAGCTIEGSLEAAKTRVLPLLRTALKNQGQGF